MILFQAILLLIILSLSYGPFGHYFNLAHGGPDLFILTIWAFSWLTNRDVAIRWAIMLGLGADLLNFQFFGFWTLMFVAATYLIIYLKGRFFEVSSVIEALIGLLIVNLVLVVIAALVSWTFQPEPLLIGGISNLLIGAVLYYFLVIRYRLTEQWQGRRL